MKLGINEYLRVYKTFDETDKFYEIERRAREI